ncbi:HK97 family phage prohead protease [Lacipirellula sp.]|uniref:HK97 family phage prohead protease n=1 Tax=Lacipirellula sp. TaxID=2691419 RepID=UPI003D097615
MIELRNTGPGNSKVKATYRGDGAAVVVGYSAVFYTGQPGTEYVLGEGIVERIRPGAFDRAIRDGHDARALFNHDANNLLGRVSSGTCRLSADSHGLRYEITVDRNDPDHQRVLAKIRRGDLSGSSFAFQPLKVTWEERDGLSIRWLADIQLFDVGPVTWPAYGATTTGLRNDELEAIEKERKDWPALQLRLRQLKLAQLEAAL